MNHRKLRTIEMNRLSIEEFHDAEKLPLIVVLDDVRSLYPSEYGSRWCR